MTPSAFNMTLHMVASADGYIAKKDNSISWFETTSIYDKGVIGQDPAEFLKAIDCYVMGSHTYELAIELSKNYGWPYGDKPTVVLTSRALHDKRANIHFYSGNIMALVNEQLKPKYNNVWVVGGAAVAKAFLQQKLVDEIRVSILPILLGEGLLYFNQLGIEQKLVLKDSVAYKNGMVELCYLIPEV